MAEGPGYWIQAKLHRWGVDDLIAVRRLVQNLVRPPIPRSGWWHGNRGSGQNRPRKDHAGVRTATRPHPSRRGGRRIHSAALRDLPHERTAVSFLPAAARGEALIRKNGATAKPPPAWGDQARIATGCGPGVLKLVLEPAFGRISSVLPTGFRHPASGP